MFKTLDALLRGMFTDRDRLQDGGIAIPIGTLIRTALVLGATYGALMGFYSLFTWKNKSEAALQMVSSALKVPLLFLLTLMVTFPSLYVLSALTRTRLGAADTGRLLLIAITVTLALLASLGPITAFFTVSTDSYAFMVLLNVLFFSLAGFAGLTFLRRTLTNLLKVEESTAAEEEVAGRVTESESTLENKRLESSVTDSGNPDQKEPTQYDWVESEEPNGETFVETEAIPHSEQRARSSVSTQSNRQPNAVPPRVKPSYIERAYATARTRRLFAGWCILFGVVGSQMGWVLRPFIGNPYQPFQIFRERDSNFLSAVFRTLGELFQ